MLRYGFDLSKLKEENELKYIELDRRRHILTMAGELKVVDNVIEVVQKVLSIKVAWTHLFYDLVYIQLRLRLLSMCHLCNRESLSQKLASLP
jgi:hypothetical protein